jgi:hypothetical protein
VLLFCGAVEIGKWLSVKKERDNDEMIVEAYNSKFVHDSHRQDGFSLVLPNPLHDTWQRNLVAVWSAYICRGLSSFMTFYREVYALSLSRSA